MKGIVKSYRSAPLSWNDLHALLAGESFDPHRILGLHDFEEDKKVIRVFRPGATLVHLQLKAKVKEMVRIHEAGLFELCVPASTKPEDYAVYDYRGETFRDPYTFSPYFGELDSYLFATGTHYNLYEKMGASLLIHQGVKGTLFTLWAPNAKAVSLVGDFNYWNGLMNPMRALGSSGVWEIFIPGLGEGEKYKFEIRTQEGDVLVKADPYAMRSELRPQTASLVADVDRFAWSDQEWMEKRASASWWKKPINIYEVHLGSWKLPFGNFLNYRELAHQLGEYCQYMGYTHVELMSIAEHPLDESWGYQVTGYYSVSSRYGSPEDFQYFVNHMHQLGIGVILDWVPGHFPTDAFSLGRFDGTALYEHADPKKGFHPHWNTYIFNYGRHEVSNFLIANADFWCQKMHIDGLRVDAVASMIYLDYGREDGEWIPNEYGGKENLEALEFLRHLNAHIHGKFPGVLMIAEESTSFSGVTHMVKDQGLGFDFKWDMGWMNDTLSYLSLDPIHRKYHQNSLTFHQLYAYSEKFALVLSHDEVVHGKKSLLSKMPGDWWQKFANLRLLLSYMMGMPGKKLLFQGGELGQWNEWYCKEEISWYLLSEHMHRSLHHMVRELNHLYLRTEALWENDHEGGGFEWVDISDSDNSVVSYLRKSASGSFLFCVHHFTPNFHGDYFLPLRNIHSIREVFNSDDVRYGGSGKVNPSVWIEREPSGFACGVKVQLAPLATMMFEVEFAS